MLAQEDEIQNAIHKLLDWKGYKHEDGKRLSKMLQIHGYETMYDPKNNIKTIPNVM